MGTLSNISSKCFKRARKESFARNFFDFASLRLFLVNFFEIRIKDNNRERFFESCSLLSRNLRFHDIETKSRNKQKERKTFFLYIFLSLKEIRHNRRLCLYKRYIEDISLTKIEDLCKKE